jgi:hypothetical protein
MDGADTQLRASTSSGGQMQVPGFAIVGPDMDGGDITLSYEWYDESPQLGNGLLQPHRRLHAVGPEQSYPARVSYAWHHLARRLELPGRRRSPRRATALPFAQRGSWLWHERQPRHVVRQLLAFRQQRSSLQTGAERRALAPCPRRRWLPMGDLFRQRRHQRHRQSNQSVQHRLVFGLRSRETAGPSRSISG